MFIVMEEDDEGMGDDFLGGQLRSEAFDEDFLVLVMRKIAVNSDARINILFFGQDGFNREVLEVDRNGLRGRRFLVVLTGLAGCGALIFLDNWGFGHDILSFANWDVRTGVDF